MFIGFQSDSKQERNRCSAGVFCLLAGFIAAGCGVRVDAGKLDLPQFEIPAKSATHVNWVQCSNDSLEVLVDVSSSDLEAQDLRQSVVSVRDRKVAASAYDSFTTNLATMITWGNLSDPQLREFDLGVRSGLRIRFSTYDFLKGSALYSPSSDSGAGAVSLACGLQVARPAPLPPTRSGE